MSQITTATGSPRPLPALSDLTRPFWTGGADGVLRVQRCTTCERLVHPPALVCPHDHAPGLVWTALSGRGVVESFTCNTHQWFPGIAAPYLVALVSLAEDPATRVLTNLVGVDADEVAIGMHVEVTFAEVADPDDPSEVVHLPVFTPVTP